MDYIPLTKKITVNNQECIACALYGTDKCKIHTEKINGCADCPVLSAMLNQLFEFEKVYLS